MNKKLIALAVAAAVVAPAAFAADNEVVLYGQVNMAVVIDNTAAGKPGQLKIESESSRIGFKGQEDLGGGTKAFFKVETKILPDNAGSTGFASREGWVGLKGDFGSVSLGRGKSLYTLATEEWDLWYQDFSLGLTNYDLATYRVNNVARYEGETGPVSYGVEYAAGEDKTAGKSASREFNGRVKYATDAWWLQSAYSNKKAPAADASVKNFLIGGGVTFGQISAGLGYENHKSTAMGVQAKRNNIIANVNYDAGAFQAYAGYIAAGKFKVNGTTVDNSNQNQFSLGVAVPLSKRTTVVTEFSQVDQEEGSPVSYGDKKNANRFSLGLYHSF